MIAIFIFAAVAVAGLVLLLARYGAPIAGERADRRPPMPLASLRTLTIQLLGALGFSVAAEPDSDQRCLVATRREPLGEIRYVVILAPEPRGGVVEPTAVLELAENVKGERAAAGILVTSGAIDTAGLAGLEVELELLDGPRFREMITQYLPERLGVLDPYRGFGAVPA